MTRNMSTEKARVVVIPANMASGKVTTQRKGTMSPYTGFGIGILSTFSDERTVRDKTQTPLNTDSPRSRMV